MAVKRMLAIHTKNAKSVQADVQEADILDFGDAALEAFKKEDPDATVTDILIVQVDHGTMNLRTSFLKDIMNPPQPQPVRVVTHSRE